MQTLHLPGTAGNAPRLYADILSNDCQTCVTQPFAQSARALSTTDLKLTHGSELSPAASPFSMRLVGNGGKHCDASGGIVEKLGPSPCTAPNAHASPSLPSIYEYAPHTRPSPPVIKRRGTRNSRYRTSAFLSAKQIGSLISAIGRAVAIGLPLNRFITIHWENAGISDDRAAWATGEFIKRLKNWLNKQGYQSAHVWVRENGPRQGSHVHILFYVDVECVGRLPALQRRWLKAITQSRYRKKTIYSRYVGLTVKAASSLSPSYLANLEKAAHYIMKGTIAVCANEYRLPKIQDCGEIIGKRCAVSENIGDAARRRRQYL